MSDAVLRIEGLAWRLWLASGAGKNREAVVEAHLEEAYRRKNQEVVPVWIHGEVEEAGEAVQSGSLAEQGEWKLHLAQDLLE